MTKAKVEELIAQGEGDRVEFTISEKEKKIGETLCAFCNDLPGHGLPVYLLIGVNDYGTIAGKSFDDEALRGIGDVRHRFTPRPSITVHQPVKFDDEGYVLVIEAHPSKIPPIRYRGKIMIRIGPRQETASIEDERLLS